MNELDELLRGRRPSEAFTKYFWQNMWEQNQYRCDMYHDFLVRPDYTFELIAYMAKDGTLEKMEYYFASFTNFGHGGGRSQEYELSAKNYKKAMAVAEICFPSRSAGDVRPAIEKALEKREIFEGLHIVQEQKTSVAFETEDKKRTSIRFKDFATMLEYSHIQIDMMLDYEVMKEHCEGWYTKADPRAMWLLAKNVDVTKYPEYDRLRKEYEARKASK